MSRNVVFLLLLTAILALGLIACTPTIDANTALPTAEVEVMDVTAMPTIDSEVGDLAKSPLATVDQAAMSGSFSGGDEGVQMENNVVEMQGDETTSETPALENSDGSGIVNPAPGGSGIAPEDNTADSDSDNLPDGAPGSTDSGPANRGETDPEMELNPETWLVYTNHLYGFQVSHPEAYVIREPGVQLGAGIDPAPLATVAVVDPVMVQGEPEALQPPELTIYIYDNSARKPLDAWLRDAGKLNPDLGLSGEPYASRAGAGVRICLQTFVAPNCSIFFANEDKVYELTPLGLVGEAMVKTFAFTS